MALNKPFTQVMLPMFNVKSIEETLRFYTNTLGFLAGFKMPGPDGKLVHAEVTLGNVTIMLGRTDMATMEPAFAKTTWATHTKNGALGGGFNLFINLGLGSIDAYFKTIRERGAKTVNEPETKFWGDRIFTSPIRTATCSRSVRPSPRWISARCRRSSPCRRPRSRSDPASNRFTFIPRPSNEALQAIQG